MARKLGSRQQAALRQIVANGGGLRGVVAQAQRNANATGNSVVRELVSLAQRGNADEREEAALNVQLNNPSMQGEWDLDKLANISEEFDLDLSDDLGFTETDIDFMFDGDDRFSQLFESEEGEKMRGDLEAVKAARKESAEKLKERNSIEWYVGIVFETKEDRERFLREISIPIHEQYVTEEQVRRIIPSNTSHK